MNGPYNLSRLHMTDLEATRLCAEAFGFEPYPVRMYETWALESPSAVPCKLGSWAGQCIVYDPLRNDAQAMSLVKRLSLCIKPMGDQPLWEVRHQPRYADSYIDVLDADLNRAIVYCVAAIQQSKKK